MGCLRGCRPPRPAMAGRRFRFRVKGLGFDATWLAGRFSDAPAFR